MPGQGNLRNNAPALAASRVAAGRRRLCDVPDSDTFPYRQGAMQPMATDTDNKQIIETVESAFKPLRCVAEIWDYGQKLRFRITDVKGGVIFEFSEIVLRELREYGRLQALLRQVRSTIEAEGATLTPHAIPPQSTELAACGANWSPDTSASAQCRSFE
jgi:hypothetical protein